jgi:hypothetical protein
MRRSNESFLLSGWLFADLLLALAVLFLAANTAGIKPRPPALVVDPARLDIQDINKGTQNCNVQVLIDTAIAQCNVTLRESDDSTSDVNWTVDSDISDGIKYTINNQPVKGGRLSHGQKETLNISAIPCQNGSFTFHVISVDNSNTVINPTQVILRCTPPKERLDFDYRSIPLTVNDPGALRRNDSGQINDIKQQLANTAALRGKKVGLAVVYGGAPTTNDIANAQDVARAVYSILNGYQNNNASAFSRSSFYVPLYNLGKSDREVQVDVYFFKSS